MGIRDWFRKERVLRDPELGELLWDRGGSWRTQVRFPPTSDDVELGVSGSEAGPSVDGARVLHALARYYGAIRAEIARELLALYEPVLDELRSEGAHEGAPHPASGDAMMELTELDGIEVIDNYVVLLRYGFREGASWPDAMFTVEVRGRVAPVVRGVALDD